MKCIYPKVFPALQKKLIVCRCKLDVHVQSHSLINLHWNVVGLQSIYYSKKSLPHRHTNTVNSLLSEMYI